MFYLRYHRILLIGIIAEKCVTRCYMKACHIVTMLHQILNVYQVNIEINVQQNIGILCVSNIKSNAIHNQTNYNPRSKKVGTLCKI